MRIEPTIAKIKRVDPRAQPHGAGLDREFVMTVTLVTRRNHVISRTFADQAAAQAFLLAMVGRPDLARLELVAA